MIVPRECAMAKQSVVPPCQMSQMVVWKFQVKGCRLSKLHSHVEDETERQFWQEALNGGLNVPYYWRSMGFFGIVNRAKLLHGRLRRKTEILKSAYYMGRLMSCQLNNRGGSFSAALTSVRRLSKGKDEGTVECKMTGL